MTKKDIEAKIKELEAEKEAIEEVVEEEAEETVETEINEAAKEVAEQISKALDLDALSKKISAIAGTKAGEVAKKVFNEKTVDTKEVSELSKEEKIVGFFNALCKKDIVQLKALAEGTPADGGYLVPEEFRAELIRDIEETNRMRSIVRVVPMTRDVLKVPKLGSKPKVTWTAENAVKSTSTADFEEKTLTAYKVAAIMYASDELVEDAHDFNVVQLIIGLFSEALAEEEDRVITVGTGVGQPTGLSSCSISSTTCSGNLDFDNMINLIYSLPAKYRRSAVFLVSNGNIRELRKVKDGNNRYIWQDAVAPGQPATIYGYPVYESNWIGDATIYFGDFKKGYWLGDRRRITVAVSQEAGQAWERDEVGIRVVERIGGNCVLEAAMRSLITIP